MTTTTKKILVNVTIVKQESIGLLSGERTTYYEVTFPFRSEGVIPHFVFKSETEMNLWLESLKTEVAPTMRQVIIRE